MTTIKLSARGVSVDEKRMNPTSEIRSDKAIIAEAIKAALFNKKG